MGGVDKAFIKLGNETLIERGIARAQPQVSELLVNANGDVARFAKFGRPVIADSISGFLGPLAGILSGLEWMRVNRPDLRWLATFACDCPFFPRDMVEQLLRRAETDRASVPIAASGNRHHPVFAIWNATLPANSNVTMPTTLRFRQFLPATISRAMTVARVTGRCPSERQR